MEKILILILGIQFTYGFSQKNIKVYQERKGDTLVYYADNQEVYPMSFVFSGTPELENAKAPEAFKKVQIIPAQSLKNQIAYFVVLDKKKKWGARKMPGYTMYIGDVSQTSYVQTISTICLLRKAILSRYIRGTTELFRTVTKTPWILKCRKEQKLQPQEKVL